MKDKNINISRDFFWALIQLEVATMQQKIIWKFFYCKTLELLENHRKRTTEATPKIEKKKKITENICSACSPMQVVVFRKHVLIFIEQRLKFYHFEGSIIP